MERYLGSTVACLFTAIILTGIFGFTGKKIDSNFPKGLLSFVNNKPTVKDKNMITDTTNMVITRIFNAPVEKVWKAWSEETLVKQWWGPKRFTCPVAKMVFHEGGSSLVCMRAPQEFGGQDMYTTWTYQKIVPMERIEYILNFSDKDGNKLDPAAIGMPPGIPKDVPHIIIFKKIGDSKTEVTVTEQGYTSAETAELSKSGMSECLDKMAEALAKV